MSTPNQALISVIIPVYNAESTLAETYASLQMQTYPHWEAFFIDDQSTDGSYALLTELAKDNIAKQKVWLLRNPEKGVSNARNLGIIKAQGQYIAFLDADDLWLPEKLQKQLSFFQADPQLALVHTNIIEFNQNGEYRARLFDQPRQAPLEGDVYSSLMINDFIATTSVMMRRDVLSQLGGFDPSLSGPEDWDLWLRVAKEYKIGFVPQVMVRYRIHPQGISKNYQKFEPELFRVYQRHLLASNAPAKDKRYGLWLFYRHMAHGLARNGKILSAWQRLLRAIPQRPLALWDNAKSIAYIFIRMIFNKRP